MVRVDEAAAVKAEAERKLRKRKLSRRWTEAAAAQAEADAGPKLMHQLELSGCYAASFR